MITPKIKSDSAKIVTDLSVDGRPVSTHKASEYAIHGHFRMRARERGKIVPGSHREGHNVFTTAGREWLSRLMAYASLGTPYRSDRIFYMGMGTGVQAEVPSVTRLVQPVAYAVGQFLAPIQVPVDLSVLGTGVTTGVVHRREFSENQLSIDNVPIDLSEAGLYTDGDPEDSYDPGSRVTTISVATSQVPVSYKTFEPFRKTSNLVVELSWEIRFE